jgi:hypothetical protein
MPTFLVISKHNPDVCAMYNETSVKTLVDYMSKAGELEAKHGVKTVGGWNVPPEHLVVQVFEAPSFEAFQAFSMEPEVMNLAKWQTMEVKVAMTLDEVWQMMQQMPQQK